MKKLLAFLRRGTDASHDVPSWTPKCKSELGGHVCAAKPPHGYMHVCGECGFRWAA